MTVLLVYSLWFAVLFVGLDESVKDKKKSVLSLGDVKISIGSRDDETIQVNQHF